MSEQAAGIGHNAPKELTEIISPAVIKSAIEIKLAPLKDRAAVLIESCRGFVADYTVISGDKPVFLIENDDQAKEAAEILGTVLAFAGSKSGLVDKTRDTFKRPVLDAGTAIGSDKQGPFFNVASSVEIAAAPIRRAALNYSVAKDEKARKDALEEAQRKADEAAIVARMAARGSETVTLDDAIQAADDAAMAQRAVDAKPATRTFMKGDMAGSSSLIYKREVVITIPAAVDRIYCVPDEAALKRAAGRAGTPIPTLAGCTVRDVPDLTVRR